MKNQPGLNIFLVRHGDSRPDETKRYIGQTDLTLNPDGEREVESCRKSLAHVCFDHLYSSDLTRCRQTARIIAGSRSPLIQFMPELREIHLGAWEAQPVAEIRSRFPEAYEERGRHLDTYRTPGGESFSDLSRRVIPFFEHIAEQDSGNILVVAHAGVNRVILCHILEMPLVNLFRLEIPYGAVTMIDKSNTFFRVRAMNCRPSALAGSVPY